MKQIYIYSTLAKYTGPSFTVVKFGIYLLPNNIKLPIINQFIMIKFILCLNPVLVLLFCIMFTKLSIFLCSKVTSV